jgi:hypothetical protein
MMKSGKDKDIKKVISRISPTFAGKKNKPTNDSSQKNLVNFIFQSFLVISLSELFFKENFNEKK